MTKRFSNLTSILALLLALALALAPGVSWAQGPYYFWWLVVDETGQPYTGETVQCSVFRANIHGAAVLHTTAQLDAGGTSPLWSDVGGRLHFYSSSSAPLDVTCYYTYGGSAYSGRIGTTVHRIVLPRQGPQVARFAVNSVSATYQTASGVVIPQGAVIRDVIIQNLAPRGLGTYHVSVGFLGDHSVATAAALAHTAALTSPDEWIRPHVQYSFTQQIMGVAGNHRGLALSDFALRHSNAQGERGWYVEKAYVVHVSTGLEVSYSAQPGTSAGVRAHVYILWDRLHTTSNRVPFGLGR